MIFCRIISFEAWGILKSSVNELSGSPYLPYEEFSSERVKWPRLKYIYDFAHPTLRRASALRINAAQGRPLSA
jgi:hypothetical protein